MPREPPPPPPPLARYHNLLDNEENELTFELAMAHGEMRIPPGKAASVLGWGERERKWSSSRLCILRAPQQKGAEQPPPAHTSWPAGL